MADEVKTGTETAAIATEKPSETPEATPVPDDYEDLKDKQFGSLKVIKLRSTQPLKWNVQCTKCRDHWNADASYLTESGHPACRNSECQAEQELERQKLAELEDLEKTMRNGLSKYVKVGKALKVIQEKKLYTLKYETFETYCEKEWGLKRQTAYEYLHAVSVVESVRVSSNLQILQTKALALYPLKDVSKRQEIVDMSGFPKMTVREVMAAVRKLQPKTEEAPEATGAIEPSTEPVTKTPQQRMIHLVTDTRKALKVFNTAVTSALAKKEIPAPGDYDAMIDALKAAMEELTELKPKPVAVQPVAEAETQAA